MVLEGRASFDLEVEVRWVPISATRKSISKLKNNKLLLLFRTYTFVAIGAMLFCINYHNYVVTI